MEVQSWPLAKITPYPGNPRTLTDKAVLKVAASIREFGFQQPIVVDSEGVIVVGHTRYKAAKKLRLKSAPVVVAANLSPAQAAAYRIADNRTNEEAAWEESLLRAEMSMLQELGFDLGPLGFEQDELQRLIDNQLTSDDEVVDEKDDTAKLLDLVAVVVAPPRHEVSPGDLFLINDKHHLCCVGVMTGWPTWAPFLHGGAVFCPYPGPFITYGRIADEHPLVIVQPDPYTCGHILDRIEETHGAEAIQKLTT